MGQLNLPEVNFATARPANPIYCHQECLEKLEEHRNSPLARRAALLLQRLAVDEYPDITYPVVMAQTSYPGASPEVMERDVSRPIEEALNTVQGIREITSTSSEGNSNVRVMLQLGMDPLEAQQEVIAKIARIRRQLPPDIDDPVVNRYDPNDRPIMSVAMQSTERPLRDLTDLAEQTIKPRFESVPGVGGVNVNGGTTRQVRVQLNGDALVAYGISPAQVSQPGHDGAFHMCAYPNTTVSFSLSQYCPPTRRR